MLQLVSLQKAKRPLLNTYSSSPLFDDNMRAMTETLIKRIRSTPELVAMLDTAVTDHFLGPVDFYSVDGKSLGSTKYNQVCRFWEDQNVQHEAFYGQALDFFIDGSSFGWYASADNFLSAKQKELITKVKASMSQNSIDEIDNSVSMPRKVSYVPASTMEIHTDEYDVAYYVQQAQGKRVVYPSDQIVHVRFMNFNGEMRGFSPLKALTKEIVMMYMLKENILAMLNNGGTPDHIISLVNSNGSSHQRFLRLQTALESFAHLRKSHGNMPIDAQVEVHTLGESLKDMEYRELAMFIISEFGLALGLPSSRIPFLGTGSGGPSNKGELSGNSEDSYQAKINARRSMFENAWNKVFRRAGFTFRFRRDNLQDSVRETQASTQRAAYVIQVQNSLRTANKKLTIPALLQMLSGSKTDIEEDDIEEIPEEELEIEDEDESPIAGPGNKMQPSNKNLLSKAKRDVSDHKEKNANNNGVYS